MERASVVLTSKDKREIKSGLATTRMVVDKLQELEYRDVDKVGVLAAALGDIRTACQRYLRLVADFDDARYPETLADPD